MMAAIGTTETFGLVINHGPWPNSPDNMNHTSDTGRQSPVSYTHLDVYKRQPLPLVLGVASTFPVLLDAKSGAAVVFDPLRPYADT